ncbi:hypothetical protein ACI65C_006456 [Semiaphis heraclei]
MNSLNINQEKTIDAKWKAVKDAIKTATVTVIGKQNRTRKPWFNNSCKEAFNRRKESRTQMLNNPYNREKMMAYKECQKEANNIFRYEKQKYTKDVLEEAEIDHKVNRTRQLYKKINSIRGGYKKHEKFLKNDDGSLVTQQDKIFTSCTSVRGYVITDLEAKILNNINKKHYGIDYQFFVGKDYVVLLDEFEKMYSFLKICYSILLNNNASIENNKCGFINIDSVSFVPYLSVEGKKYVPLFFFEGHRDTLIDHAHKCMDWSLAYLKFCCKIMGIKDEYFHCDFWPVVSFDHIKNLLPPETNFKDFWPAKASDFFLFTRKKFMHHNPPAPWFKVLPEVVTDESTLTAPAVPQSTELMMNQMVLLFTKYLFYYFQQPQEEQKPKETITTPPIQAHENSDNAAYKVYTISLEGKIINCINAKPGIYSSDLMVT